MDNRLDSKQREQALRRLRLSEEKCRFHRVRRSNHLAMMSKMAIGILLERANNRLVLQRRREVLKEHRKRSVAHLVHKTTNSETS